MLVLLNLIAGVLMLAWGIYITKSGVMRTFGANLSQIMGKALKSRCWMLRALLTGVGITSLVQSSNATAMLVSSFLAKNLIALSPALIIMLGANVGSAVMARILTFDLSWLCPVLLSVGIMLFLKRRHSKAGKIGRILIGLGIILMSLSTIVTTTRPIASSDTMSLILSSINGQFTLAIIFGALLAILCYSSLAAVILTSSLVLSGNIELDTALVIVIGANLGSCILEILGSLGNGVSAKRVMFGNFLFKLTLAVIYLFIVVIVPPLVNQSPELNKSFNDFLQNNSIAQLVIWFHLAFNISVCLFMLPLVSLYAKILCQLLPEEEQKGDDEALPKYLDQNVIDNSSLAISNTVKETIRLGGFLHDMINLFEQSLTGKTGHSAQIEEKAHTIEQLSEKIRSYLTMIEEPNEQHSTRWYQALSSTMSCSQGSDILKRMQAEISFINHNVDITFPAHERAELIKLCKKLNANLALVLNATMSRNQEEINTLLKHKANFKRTTDTLINHQLVRIRPDNGPDITTLIVTLISDFRMLNGTLCGIAIPQHNLPLNDLEISVAQDNISIDSSRPLESLENLENSEKIEYSQSILMDNNKIDKENPIVRPESNFVHHGKTKLTLDSSLALNTIASDLSSSTKHDSQDLK